MKKLGTWLWMCVALVAFSIPMVATAEDGTAATKALTTVVVTNGAVDGLTYVAEDKLLLTAPAEVQAMIPAIKEIPSTAPMVFAMSSDGTMLHIAATVDGIEVGSQIARIEYVSTCASNSEYHVTHIPMLATDTNFAAGLTSVLTTWTKLRHPTITGTDVATIKPKDLGVTRHFDVTLAGTAVTTSATN